MGGLGFMVIFQLAVVVGLAGVEIHFIKQSSNKVKQKLVQGIAMKAIEARTGVDVKSLVGQKPFIDGNQGVGSKAMDKIPAPLRVGLGAALGLTGRAAAVGQVAGRKAFGAIDNLSDNKISQATKFYSTLAQEKAKHYANSIKEGIGKTRTVRAIKQIDKGRRFIGKKIGEKMENLHQLEESTVGGRVAHFGDDMIKSAFRRRHPNTRLKSPTVDPLNSKTRLTGKGSQIRDITDMTTNMNNMARAANILNQENGIDDRLIDTESMKNQVANKRTMRLINEYKDAKGIKTAKDALNAKRYAEAVQAVQDTGDSRENEIKHQMILGLVKNSKVELDKDMLINTTNTAYTSYSNNLNVAKAVKEAQDNAMKENSKRTAQEIEDILTDPSHSKVYEEAFNKIMADGDKMGDADKYFEGVVNKIANNDRQTMIAYLGKQGAEDLQEKLTSQRESDIERAVLQQKNEIANKYMQEKGMSMEQALEHVDNLAQGAFDKDNFDKVMQETINAINSGNYNPLSNSTASSNSGNIEITVQNNVATTTTQPQNSETASAQTVEPVSNQTAQPVQGQQGQPTQTATVESTSSAVASRTDTSSIESATTTVDSMREVIKETIVNNTNTVSTTSADGNNLSIDSNTMEDMTNRAAQKAMAPFNEFLRRFGGGSRREGMEKLLKILNGDSKANLTDEIKKELATIGINSQEEINGLVATMKQELKGNANNGVMNGTIVSEVESKATILDFQENKQRIQRRRRRNADSRDTSGDQTDKPFEDAS